MRKDERVDTEERRERDVSMHIKLPLHFSLPGFLDFFRFSLSASLLSEYSSKLLLCCSSLGDNNAVAILH